MGVGTTPRVPGRVPASGPCPSRHFPCHCPGDGAEAWCLTALVNLPLRHSWAHPDIGGACLGITACRPRGMTTLRPDHGAVVAGRGRGLPPLKTRAPGLTEAEAPR